MNTNMINEMIKIQMIVFDEGAEWVRSFEPNGVPVEFFAAKIERLFWKYAGTHTINSETIEQWVEPMTLAKHLAEKRIIVFNEKTGFVRYPFYFSLDLPLPKPPGL